MHGVGHILFFAESLRGHVVDTWLLLDNIAARRRVCRQLLVRLDGLVGSSVRHEDVVDLLDVDIDEHVVGVHTAMLLAFLLTVSGLRRNPLVIIALVLNLLSRLLYELSNVWDLVFLRVTVGLGLLVTVHH